MDRKVSRCISIGAWGRPAWQDVSESVAAPTGRYRGNYVPLERESGQAGTENTLTSSIPSVPTISGHRSGGRGICGIPYAWRKASAINGKSRSFCASGWPPRTTIFMLAAEQYLPLPLGCHRHIGNEVDLCLASTNSTRTELWCWLRPSYLPAPFLNYHPRPITATPTPTLNIISQSGFIFPLTPTHRISSARRVRRIRSLVFCCQRADYFPTRLTVVVALARDGTPRRPKQRNTL